jgi:hypothetical protein
MQPVTIGALSLGVILAIVGLILCVLAFFVPAMRTFELLLGLLALSFICRLC